MLAISSYKGLKGIHLNAVTCSYEFGFMSVIDNRAVVNLIPRVFFHLFVIFGRRYQNIKQELHD